MAVEIQTPAAIAPAKGRKKKQPSATKKPSPSVSDMIVEIMSACTEKGGVSLAAIKKALAAKGYDVVKNNARVKMAVKRLVAKKILVQVKGTGASGSFKLVKKQTELKKAAKSDATKAAKSPARSRAPKTKDKKQVKKEKKSTAAKKSLKSKKDKKSGTRRSIEKPVKTSKPTKPGKSRPVKPKTVKGTKARKTGPSKK